ncbi:MAG TPA: HAD hydrolase family protein [Acetobacteraceae bacterium]
MKRIVVDLDGTLTIDAPGVSYADKAPDLELIARIRAYKAEGFEIIVATARNMRSYSGSVGKINANTLPVVLEWLRRHDVPFDEIHVGKPWCGTDGFYVDDKAIRPSEFRSLAYDQIQDLLKREANA